MAAPLVLAAVFITIFGWSWLRGPIERIALEKTGRVLQINGDFWAGRGRTFTLRIGRSDVAGTFELDTGGKRPALKAELGSKLLDIADLGPLIGVRPNRSQTTTATKTTRVLPDLQTHLSLRDSVLTLDPLNFGMAGGQLNSMISLDGRQDPIQAKARLKAEK